MKRRKARVVLGVWAASLLGCRDDGAGLTTTGAEVPRQLEAQSDGTGAGDFVALQVALAEAQCACAGEAADWCLDIVWPQGQASCVRHAYQANAGQDLTVYACGQRLYREAIHCWAGAGCDQARTAKCLEAFAAGQQACPQLDADTAAVNLTCVETGATGLGETEDSSGQVACSEGESVDTFYLCDGFIDCDDRSDELDCEQE